MPNGTWQRAVVRKELDFSTRQTGLYPPAACAAHWLDLGELTDLSLPQFVFLEDEGESSVTLRWLRGFKDVVQVPGSSVALGRHDCWGDCVRA